MKNPLVSIIIPTYNRGHLLSETLNSVINQTYQNWECNVVDDGSHDDTKGIVKELAKKDSRISFYERPQNKIKGANSCRNYGFEMSKGEFINWLDDDDVFSFDKIEKQVQRLQNIDEERVLITTKWTRFEKDTQDEEFWKSKVNKDFYSGYELLKAFGDYGYFYPSHAYLVSRKTILYSGLWNERLTVNQDGEFFARVILNSDIVLHAYSGGVYYRRSTQNNTSKLDSINKQIDSINSWTLIDSHIKIHNKNPESLDYIKTAKIQMDIKIRDPKIRKPHYFFFVRTKLVPYMYRFTFVLKVLNKLKII